MGACVKIFFGFYDASFKWIGSLALRLFGGKGGAAHVRSIYLVVMSTGKWGYVTTTFKVGSSYQLQPNSYIYALEGMRDLLFAPGLRRSMLNLWVPRFMISFF